MVIRDRNGSFLITKRDKKSYDDKLVSSPESTKRNKMLAVKTFEKFCKGKYQKSSNDVIDEVNKIKQVQPTEYENALYGLLQE